MSPAGRLAGPLPPRACTRAPDTPRRACRARTTSSRAPSTRGALTRPALPRWPGQRAPRRTARAARERVPEKTGGPPRAFEPPATRCTNAPLAACSERTARARALCVPVCVRAKGRAGRRAGRHAQGAARRTGSGRVDHGARLPMAGAAAGALLHRLFPARGRERDAANWRAHAEAGARGPKHFPHRRLSHRARD